MSEYINNQELKELKNKLQEDLEIAIKARYLDNKSIKSPEKLKEQNPTKQQEISDIENVRERLGNAEHNEKLNNFLLTVLIVGIVFSVIGLVWSHWVIIPRYEIEYNKQIFELKNEYNSKILEQQNTINLQQEKIQNLEDDVKGLKEVINKYFVK